jgi:hypothetical protein
MGQAEKIFSAVGRGEELEGSMKKLTPFMLMAAADGIGRECSRALPRGRVRHHAQPQHTCAPLVPSAVGRFLRPAGGACIQVPYDFNTDFTA